VTAIAAFDDGSTRDVTGQAMWSSSATGVATVSAGWVSGTAPGSAQISASYSGSTGAATIAVVPGLQSITVTPRASVPKGLAVQMTAIGAYADGTSRDLTSRATWTSSDPLRGAVRPDGQVSTLAVGAVDITAHFAALTGAATVAVMPAAAVQVSVSPAGGFLHVGQTLQLTAVATMTDGTVLDVTGQATWASRDTAIATVSSTGRVTAVAPGAPSTYVPIEATYQGIPSDSAITVGP
ncbi:MAG TPA: Ig-like domain-containing protein, partial [Kofleriaceae bacterium]